MKPKIIRLQGSHFDIGVQHGKQLASVIVDSVLPFIESMMIDSGITADDVRKISAKYENLVGDIFPEVIEETKGIAEGAGINYEKALLTLFFWEVRDTGSHSFPECSSFVASGDATADGKPIASQNSDWPKEMSGKGLGQTFHVTPKGRYSFMGRGLAGNLGRPSVIGFNKYGLGFVGSGIRQLQGAGFGFPPLIISRIGLERCNNVDEFLELLKEIPRWSHAGENLNVVDKDGYIARISFSTKRLMIAHSKDHFLASTNHYHHLEMRHFGPKNRETYPSSWARYERLVELLRENYGSIDSKRAMKMMSDHKYGNQPPHGAKSICRHGEKTQTMTNVVFLPSQGEFWIANGTPCQKEYSHYRL